MQKLHVYALLKPSSSCDWEYSNEGNSHGNRSRLVKFYYPKSSNKKPSITFSITALLKELGRNSKQILNFYTSLLFKIFWATSKIASDDPSEYNMPFILLMLLLPKVEMYLLKTKPNYTRGTKLMESMWKRLFSKNIHDSHDNLCNSLT